MSARIAFQHVAAELRGAAHGERLKDQLMQRSEQPAILSLKGRPVAAEDVGNFAVRSRHDLTAIGRLGIFGKQIGKRIFRARCTGGNVRIGRRSFKACMSEYLLNHAYIHASLQAMGRIAVA
jgi:hypothetical protein